MPSSALRLLKHRWYDVRDVHRVLDAAALDRLEAAIRASELRHSGEIRVCVEAALPWADLRARTSAHERALTVFGQLGVWDTEANNGVLIYLLLADRAIEVIADRGLARQVPAAHWQGVVQGLIAELRAGEFERGLMAAVAAVGQTLDTHFPLPAGAGRNPNELPDRPVIIG